jgi:HAD superfamily hydrolase (TIGR01509 family)
MVPKAIIFDIDGVIADSREAVVENTIRVLAEFGYAVAPERVHQMASAHSATSVFVWLVPELEGNEERLTRMLDRLAEITHENLSLVKPTPLTAHLDELSRKYLLGAATNRRKSGPMVLKRLGIAHYFKAVVTSSDSPMKPSPDMLVLALERLGVKPEEAVFVGDNKEDSMAGEAAGIRTIVLDCTKKENCEKFLGEFLPGGKG